jgi:hypothetical protein
MEAKQIINVRNIPVELWRKVKAAAAVGGKSVSQFLIEIMERAVTGRNHK